MGAGAVVVVVVLEEGGARAELAVVVSGIHVLVERHYYCVSIIEVTGVKGQASDKSR